jgi:DNA-directed RNA polymerase specialized sigma subunit
LDRLDVLEERERVAKAYMAWFIPAWDRLTEQEQLILTEFFMVSNQFRNGARGRLASKLNYTERHIDRLRADAIQKLQTLLFG